MKEPKPSTSTSSPLSSNKRMDRAEKPKRPFEKQIKSLDVDRRKKMYKNKRKPVHEKNLRQDPAIIPLESTNQQKDPRLDLNIHWIYLNSTMFTEEIEEKSQPVLHITEDPYKEDNLKRDAEEALQIIEEIISEDKTDNSQISETIQYGLITPVLEDINLAEMELVTINTNDLVEIFPKEDFWLTIDQTGNTDEVEFDQQHCSPTPYNILDYILDEQCL